MVSSFCFRPTVACLRKALVTIPRLSPTLTQAKIVRFCPPGILDNKGAAAAVAGAESAPAPAPVYVDITDTLFILECSPDVVAEESREQTEEGNDVNPLMIVESHDEGDFRLRGSGNDDDKGKIIIELNANIKLNEWYDVGHVIGEIDDGDDDDGLPDEEWLWQAYPWKEGEEGRELNLPPHIATGKITN